MLSDKVFAAICDGSVSSNTVTLIWDTRRSARAAVQNAIEEENLIPRVNDMGLRLNEALGERFGNHHHVGIFVEEACFRPLSGIGPWLQRAVRPGMKVNAKVKQEAMKRGLICYPMGGTIDGVWGDHALLAPPFIIEVHIEELVENSDSVDQLRVLKKRMSRLIIARAILFACALIFGDVPHLKKTHPSSSSSGVARLPGYYFGLAGAVCAALLA